MSEPLIHLAAKPFVAVCGADVPNQRTTTVRGHVTCLHCLWPGGGRRMTEQRLTPEREAELRGDNGCTCCGEPQDAPVELLAELDAVRAEAAALRKAEQEARTATGLARHTDAESCVGCGCMAATTAELVAALRAERDAVRGERDRLAAFVGEPAREPCECYPTHPEFQAFCGCLPCRARQLLEAHP